MSQDVILEDRVRSGEKEKVERLSLECQKIRFLIVKALREGRELK